MIAFYESSVIIEFTHPTDSSLVILPYRLTVLSRDPTSTIGSHGTGDNAKLEVDVSGLKAIGRIEISWPLYEKVTLNIAQDLVLSGRNDPSF